jgi:hypothetical protein
MSVWPVIAFATITLAAAQAADTCGEREINALSIDQVTVTKVESGFFQNNQRYAIRCGSWSAQALYDKSGASIALMILDESNGAAPVPAPIAARLYRLPLKRLFTPGGSAAASEYNLTVRNYTELETRMADAAQKSPAWDGDHGRPRSGASSAFVMRLLNTDHLYPEVSGLAGELGYRVRVSGVEEVRLCRRLPCGALISFQLYR